jgi:cytidyltransferase-like protein
VVSQRELISRRGQWKRTGQGVVCASRCFDLLHPVHIRLLENARSLGDILVVAIESDATAGARSTPGNGLAKQTLARPIIPSAESAEILAAFSAVGCGVEFEGPAPREIADIEALGCKVVRIPLEPGYSTTRLIERILERRV